MSWWRGHDCRPRVLWTLGVLLVVPGLARARGARAGASAAGWRSPRCSAQFNTRIILGVLFYLVLTPVGFVIRLFRDPLDRSLDDGRTSDWIKREPRRRRRRRYERQF